MILGAIPVWIAWHYARWFPTGDLAVIVARPLIRHLEGESLWKLMFEPSGNGHYGFILPFHLLTAKLAHWDLRLDALVVVGLAILSAACFLILLRGDELSREWRGWVLGFLGVAVMLSSQQMMNWMASIQTCYYLVVACVFLILVVWRSRLGLVTRILLASLLAFYSSFCFPNGVLAWVMTGALLLLEKPGLGGVTKSTLIRAWCLLVVLAAVAGFFFLHGLSIDLSNPDTRPLSVRVASDPWPFLKFFLQVLGLPSGMWWSGLAPQEVSGFHNWSSMLAGAIFLLAFLLALFRGFYGGGLGWLREKQVWVLLGGWGMLNGIAISLARTGAGWSSALEDRYAAFTISLTLATLVLWGAERTRAGRVGWIALVVLLTVGWLGAAADGFAKAVNYNAPLKRTAAAVMFRKVAPVPGWEKLPGIVLESSERSREQYIDIMDRAGWMRTPTVQSLLVKDAPLKTTPFARGSFVSAEINAAGSFSLRAWAVNEKGRSAVDALAISIELPGQPERWLGTCMNVFRSRAFNRLARIDPSDERIGWQFDLDDGSGSLVQERMEWLRCPDATAAVLRIYAIDFARLELCLVGSGRIGNKP